MTILNRAALYCVSLVTFLALDLFWLGVVATDFYAKHLATHMRPDVLWIPAVLFYLLFVAGVVFFVTEPASRTQSWRRAAGSGALFGLVTYAAFDLTCMALFRDFPLVVVLVDLTWGAFLSASVATVGCFFACRMTDVVE